MSCEIKVFFKWLKVLADVWYCLGKEESLTGEPMTECSLRLCACNISKNLYFFLMLQLWIAQTLLDPSGAPRCGLSSVIVFKLVQANNSTAAGKCSSFTTSQVLEELARYP